MIRRHLMALRLGLVMADGAIATLVFLFASRVRYGDGEWIAIWNRLGIDIRIASLLFGIAWVAALWFEGLYQLRARWKRARPPPWRTWPWRSLRRASA